MNHSTNFTGELDKPDEDILYEVSDETLEAAAGIGGQSMMTIGPTIMMGAAADLGEPAQTICCPGRAAAKLLTRDEARRIAANIGKLPELLRKA